MSHTAPNPCLDCGACCASFRVSFYWSEAEARGLPVELTEQVNAWFSCDSMPALGGGLVTGAPWISQVELGYTYNFGIYRDPGGAPPTKGGHGIIFFWSKDL